ncbi:hypothetical protein DV532_27090 (plasmid) [Pseudomonas sp. Leaf58]|uniref:hypothetical protein n=1 Tax=Pseudomonas sp. Leaf58 TaxID=1736226 RepID=UPI0007002F3F|nr:hypothetical protein [Pseudomonas sp. Leaf58]AYG47949.1 hypothetical protein DV532_27090 [Pseudomonas sp. Leaf58]KQN62488.1 hypothetical protein ASF02_10080 [Pseudomonas sp. Leaf58]
MKLVIPRLKADHLALTKKWTFHLHHEERNASLGAHLNIAAKKFHWSNKDNLATEVTLPKGTVMTVDRYYIRQGNEQFDSITFLVHEIDGKVLKKKLRFWVKLDEALTLDFKYL